MFSSWFSCVHRALAGLPGLALVLTSGFAAAQATPAPAPEDSPEAAPSEEPAPKIQLTKKPMIDLATPPPSAPEGRTFHSHDGFSVRVNVGLGTLLGATVSPEVGSDITTGGLTLSYDLLIGGAPSPGFTLGGGVSGSLQLSGDWEVDGGPTVGGGNLNTFILGPFAQGYPDPHGNLHFGGMIGLAQASLDTNESASALGVGGAFWAGSGVWVAPDWSVGGLLRLDALRATDDDITVTSIGLSLMFSVLYN
jgi:hypothetical protein